MPPSKTVFVIRAKVCQPDGIGYVGKDYYAEPRVAPPCYRDLRHALTFDTEADAWSHLACFDNAWGRDEDGAFFWVEEVAPWTQDTQGAARD